MCVLWARDGDRETGFHRNVGRGCVYGEGSVGGHRRGDCESRHGESKGNIKPRIINMGRFRNAVKLAMLLLSWFRTILYAYDLLRAGEEPVSEGNGEDDLGVLDGGGSGDDVELGGQHDGGAGGRVEEGKPGRDPRDWVVVAEREEE